jgi:glucose/arabinose dehydrogenase
LRGRRALAPLLAVALLIGAACGGENPTGQTGRPDSKPPAGPESTPDSGADASAGGELPELAPRNVVTDLDTVWAITFGPDGALHFTERAGRVGRAARQADGSFAAPEVSEVQGVVEQGEGGLMGIAVDSDNRRFVMYTSASDNRVVELRADGSQRVLVDGIERGSIHNGGRLAFGPDGALYATTGDAGDRALTRSDGLNGRVLKIDPDTGEADVFTTGHRNPQGLCFDSQGRLLSTEHGPDRGDEVNYLREGEDYGWPETEGTGIANWTPTIAPAGCVVHPGGTLAQLEGQLLFTTLKGRSLRRLELADDLVNATEGDPLLEGALGRLRDVAADDSGRLFVATSNGDGRGSPQPGDDRIVELGPV